MQPITCEELEQICRHILEQAGATQEDASISAEVLVLTDMRGVFSHGCMRLKVMVDCLQSGGFHSGVEPVIEHETPISAVMDASAGIGLVASVKATRLAIDKARNNGIGVVLMHNSHHNGASGIYSMMCADQGLIGLAMTNVPPIMAVTGSNSNSIGNNPFSYACPAGKYRAIMIDIAMSTVASGKLVMYAEEKKPIPYGWLLDSMGNDTNDPSEHFKSGSTLLPFAGHKGYALAVMVESLAGALSGAAVLIGNRPWNKDPLVPGNTGHTFIALNPSYLNPGVEFVPRIEKMIETMRAAPKAAGVERIYYPGELEIEKEREAEQQGIMLPPASLASMREAARLTGVILPDALQ
ncbi:MAG: Ldh family oxidoreductase [Bacillota bacterium]|nr:Ldh family oxidoreductase [Bacillota bacterium]